MAATVHALDMTQPGNYEVGSGPQVNAAANANLNGPNIKYPISAAAAGIPTLPGFPNWCRTCLNPNEPFVTASGNLYQIGAFGVDPAEPSGPTNDPSTYWQGQAWHEFNQEFTYVRLFMPPGRAYNSALTGDLPNSGNRRGSFDANTLDQFGQPLPYLQSPKIAEDIHDDAEIDGNEGIQSNGHNALGWLTVFNRSDLPQQFTSNDPSVPFSRPWSSGSTADTQSTDWTQPWFQPAITDKRAWLTYAYGGGNVAAHDNTAGWAVYPLVPDQVYCIVTTILKHDTAGRIRAWVFPIGLNGVLDLSLVNAFTLSTPPNFDFSGSTAHYVAGTADFDRTRPKSLASDNPQRLQKHPGWCFADINYNGSVNPSAQYVKYATFPKRFTTLAAAIAEVTGGIPPGDTAPVNSQLPSIAGSAVVGTALQGAVGSWAGTPTPTLTATWNRNGTPISGATASSYTLVTADIGTQITYVVTGSSIAGTAVATSAAVGPVQAAIGGFTIVHEASAAYQVFGTADSRIFTGPSTANRVMLIQFAGKIGADTLTGVTVNGATATLVATRGQGQALISIYRYTAPPTGSLTVAWAKSGSAQNVTWGWTIYSGVDQTAPISFNVLNQAGNTQDPAGGQKFINAVSTSGDLIHSLAVFVGGTTSSGPTADPSLTTRWSINQSTTEGGAATIAGGSSVYVAWTSAVGPPFDWAILAVSVVPAAVVAAAPTNQQLPGITGTAQENAILSAVAGVFDEHGATTTYAYQWERCDSAGASPTNISGATGAAYTLVTADVGHTIRVKQTATNSGGATPASSVQTAVVLAAPVAPTNTAIPTVVGTAQQGETLAESSVGTWTQSPAFTRQWFRCDPTGANGVPIAGATAATYVPVAGDVGSTLRERVTGTNIAGTAYADSAATSVIIAADGVTRPSIVGYTIFKTSGALAVDFNATVGQDARILIVAVADAYTPDIEDVTASTTPMLEQLHDVDNSGAAGLAVYWLPNPAIGTVPIHLDLNTTRSMVIRAIAVKDCDSVAPFETFALKVGDVNTQPSLSCPSGADDLVLGMLTFKDIAATSPPTDALLQSQVGSDQVLASGYSTRAVDSQKHGTVGSTTMAWTIAPEPAAGWSLAMFGIKPAPAATTAPPVLVTDPTISGTARVGQVLTLTSHGVWNNTDSDTDYSPQWVRDTNGDGVYVNLIAGAVAGSYTLQAADAGSDVTCFVTAQNASGPGVAQSNDIGPIAAIFATSVIDKPTRASENPNSKGGFWSGPVIAGQSQTKVLSNSGDGVFSNADLSGMTFGQSYIVGESHTDLDRMCRIREQPGSSGNGVGMMFRITGEGTATPSFYEVTWLLHTGLQIFKCIAGSYSAPLADGVGATVYAHDLANFDYLRGSCVGSTITIEKGVDNGDGTFTWTLGLQVTDTSIAGPGTWGFELSDGTTWIDEISETVVSAAPSNTAVPVISGTATLGQTLTATLGTWDDGPTSFAVQWKRGGVAISGATAQTYKQVAADVGAVITVTVTATNGLGNASATSSGTSAVAGLAPVCLIAPVITGVTVSGQTLTGSNGTWSNNPASFAQQWETADLDGSNPVEFAGADTPSFLLTDQQIGDTMIIAVTATNATASVTAASQHSGTVRAKPQPGAGPANPTLPSAGFGPSFADELLASLVPLDQEPDL